MSPRDEVQVGYQIKVFVSYARKDLATVEQLRDALIEFGFEAYLDLHDILPGEPWKERLGVLIASADTVVFALSPDSVASEVVDWEVNEAERLSKRILPVVMRDADAERVPGRLKRLNYIFMRNSSEWAGGLEKLKSALLTDIDWIREHTRLGELAEDWQRRGQPDEPLLRGALLIGAEHWILERPYEAPHPTELQLSFLRASHEGEQRRLDQERARIAEVDKAQARTRSAQRRTAVVLGLVAIGVAVASWGVYQFWNRVMLGRSEFIAGQSLDQFYVQHDRVTAELLALEGLPDVESEQITQRLIPFDGTSKQALHDAYTNYARETWIERRVFTIDEGIVLNAQFSPDGKRLVTGSTTASILWDVETGERLAIFPGL